MVSVSDWLPVSEQRAHLFVLFLQQINSVPISQSQGSHVTHHHAAEEQFTCHVVVVLYTVDATHGVRMVDFFSINK